jgi:predicted ATPase/DNA-binding CsgD family transcriptional regulator
MDQNANLTQRELEILRLLSTGMSDREIADTVYFTIGTVKWYNRQIYSKLGVRNRTQAITTAQQLRLLVDSLPAAPSSTARYTYNLPAQVTSFIGRQYELAELQKLVLTTRLVTLTGPPGTGKTRLAQEAAAALCDSFSDGAIFVSLAPLREPALIANAIAQALDIKESSGESLLARLEQYLSDRHLLLVLDNYEHLLPEVSLVSELLKAAPHLIVMVTSREVLNLYGEHEFPVPPLQLPDLKQTTSLGTLKAYESVELFVQRAQAASPSFALDQANAASVATICVHLDGLPLAIELAAARIKFYAPQTLLLRLGSRLEVLNEGPRDLPVRQQTLRATLAWSYDLLADEEKVLFARLGVFAGGCSLEDVEAVCSGDLTLPVAVGLESLVNKNLLRQEQNSQGEPRFMMLETMREYALEKLDEQAEAARMNERHARHFMAVVARAAQEFYGPDEAVWLVWLDAQMDNLRAALRWSFDHHDAETWLQFVNSQIRFWDVRGHLSEGRSCVARLRNLKRASEPSKALADALRGIGDVVYLGSDFATAGELYQSALDIYEALGDSVNAAHALIGLGEVATEIGDYVSAPALFEKAHHIMQQCGDVPGCARALTQWGWGALRVGDMNHARAQLEQGLALFLTTNDTANISLVYSGLGEIAIRQGELESAQGLLEKSLAMRQALGEKWGIAVSLGSLGWVALRQSDFERAVATLQKSFDIRKEIGDKGGMAWCLEKMAQIAQLKDDAGRAARIFGAAAAMRVSNASVIDPTDVTGYEQSIEYLRSKLSDDIFNAVWSEGQAMTLEQIIHYVFPTFG